MRAPRGRIGAVGASGATGAIGVDRTLGTVGFKGLAILCAALAMLGGVGSAAAQGYPQRPVRMIVPFAAGGTTDALGRVAGVYLSERLGQQVVVENRPGGGGTVGPEVVARAAPDGYTLLMGSAEAFGMTQAIARRLPYNPDKDLAPVTMLARASNAVVVHPSVPARTLKELIELARANPGKFRYGSPGIGSNPHLIGELFTHRFGITMPHVPYKGGGNSIIDVVSGQIEVLITGVATVSSRARSGQVRALAVTGAERTPLMPEVPTMSELIDREFVLGALFGVFVPAATPGDPIARLARELTAVSQNAEFRKKLVDIGQEVTEPLTGEAFGRYISAEAQRWRDLAQMAGVKDE